jgi:hypothetical protein
VACLLALLAALPFALGGTRTSPGASRDTEQLTARRLVVTDKEGKKRAELGASDSGEVGLKLFVQDKVRTDMRLDASGLPTLTYYDEADKSQLSLVGGADAGFTVSDKKGDPRVQLGMSGDGSSMFTLRADELKIKIQLGVRGSGVPFFDLYDAKEQHVPLIAKDGTPNISRSGQ